MNDIPMTQRSRAVFNDEDRNEIRLAAGKPLVYLDSCIWIDIAERFEPLSQRCRSLVKAGKALFPVSFSAVNEVLEQPTAASYATLCYFSRPNYYFPTPFSHLTRE